MKKIKCFLFLLLFLFGSISNAQDNIFGNDELYIFNNTSNTVYFTLYPVSMLFNGVEKYNLVAKGRRNNETVGFNTDYINGVSYEYSNSNDVVYYNLRGFDDGGTKIWQLAPNGSAGFNADFENAANGDCGQIGYGVYKLKMYNTGTNRVDSCLIDFDYYFFNGTLSTPGDLKIYLENDTPPPNKYRFYYWFDVNMTPDNDFVEITYSTIRDYTIRSWEPNKTNTYNSRNKVYGPSSQNGYFVLANESSPWGNWNTIPQDPKMDCNLNWFPIAMNHEYPLNYTEGESDERQGILTLWLSVEKDVYTPVAFNSCNTINRIPPPIAITEGAKLKLAQNKKITMRHYTEADCGTSMYVKPGGILTLESNSNIEINDKNLLKFEANSYVNSGSNARVDVYPGGVFCNQGAIMSGSLRVVYHGGIIHYPICYTQGTDNIVFNDSTIIQLMDGAILDIPENASLIIDGPGASIQLDSGSSINFGYNSKLIVRNGANIKAYYSKFTSTSSTTLWDGVYLEDCSNDTLQYCEFDNAYSGLNIRNKSNSYTVAGSALVTNCLFKNTSASQLLNGIYAYNSNLLLIKDNTFQSTNLNNGFICGIFLNGCPTGNINVIGNTISNASSGITSVQTSPLISRNTLNGITGTGSGIYLDNSNGSIKYNNINYYSSSILMYYSNPYLLKNNLSNPSDANIILHTSSVPILKPIINGTSEYWYSGNNILTGSPTSGAITFQEDSYPEMDLGYNKNAISQGYYLKGDIPYSLNYSLYCTKNYWGSGGAPKAEEFDLTQGDVYTDPYYDGSALPAPESYDLVNIGFNLYDTIYIKGLGDSPERELFVEANNYENQGQYSNAIADYKSIITTYKNTFYAVASLSRIFNCLDKAHSNQQSYTAHQSYLNQLKNNSTYPAEFRELCEDFIIKTKVRLGLTQDAIDDYSNIYLLNQNTSKGLHALLNKECLSASLDTTDNPNRRFNNMIDNKLRIFGIIEKKAISKNNSTGLIPDKFALSQNYPNPFNPVTNIKYDLPKDIFVSIKVYDLLGREIKTLVNEFKNAGSHIVSFNGAEFASSIYLYRIQAGSFTQVKRMVLIK